MPLSPAQGLLLSNDFLVGRFIEDSPFVIQPAHFLPFFEVPGDSERWSTTAAILPASALPFCAPIADQTTVPVARSYSFGELATSRIVCYGTQDLQSNVNDQSAVQLEMACRQLLYGFFRLLFIGNPVNPGEFIGFDNIITGAAFAGQIVDALGLALTTRLLDRAQRRPKSGDNFDGYICTSAQGYIEIRQAFLASGTLPQEVAVVVPDGNGGLKTVTMMHVNGWLVMWTDFVPIEQFQGSTVTKIWFFKFGRRHIHGIVPASGGRRSMFKIRSTLSQGSGIRYDVVFPVAISVPAVSDIAVISNVLVQPL
ncbi:MAG: hypothetical protein FD180_1973 [Planctomycetota bacterium]|nr:MAG: hypothetical protein FD180_1973 [Planctomycetota bacterium]